MYTCVMRTHRKHRSLPIKNQKIKDPKENENLGHTQQLTKISKVRMVGIYIPASNEEPLYHDLVEKTIQPEFSI